MQTHRLRMRALAGGFVLVGSIAWPGLSRAQEPAGPAAEASQDLPAKRPILNFLRDRFQRAKELRSKLDLADEQKTRIRGKITAQKEDIIKHFKKLAEKRQALRDAVLAEMPTEESIRAAADELGKAIGDAAVKASRMADELKKELTTEQLEKIRRFREERRAELHKMLDRALGG